MARSSDGAQIESNFPSFFPDWGSFPDHTVLFCLTEIGLLAGKELCSPLSYFNWAKNRHNEPALWLLLKVKLLDFFFFVLVKHSLHFDSTQNPKIPESGIWFSSFTTVNKQWGFWTSIVAYQLHQQWGHSLWTFWSSRWPIREVPKSQSSRVNRVSIL